MLLNSLFFLHLLLNFIQKRASWLLAMAICLLLGAGFYGLLGVPNDAVQQDAFRIIYVHVPAAMLSLSIYTIIGMCAAIYLIWHVKIFYRILVASLYFGMSNTLIALVTGAIWGKPMWGSWWVWDARLTAELILLFLYISLIGLQDALKLENEGPKIVSMLAVIGLLDIPIVHFSVNWWHTLHQGATLVKFSAPSIDTTMLWPLLGMLAGFYLLYIAILGFRLKQRV